MEEGLNLELVEVGVSGLRGGVGGQKPNPERVQPVCEAGCLVAGKGFGGNVRKMSRARLGKHLSVTARSLDVLQMSVGPQTFLNHWVEKWRGRRNKREKLGGGKTKRQVAQMRAVEGRPP